MKICMLAPEFLPVWGGVGTYIIELVRHLPAEMEIHVVTPLREGFGKETVSHSNYDFSKYFGKNVYVHFVSRASDTFFYNAQFQYACLKKVPKLIKEEKIDIVHSHTAQMPDLFLMLRQIGKPFVTTIHTTIKAQHEATKFSKRAFSDMAPSERATYLLYPFLRMAEEIYFQQKRFYVSPSHWMKNWLNKNHHINGNIIVIPNSVDVSDYNSSQKRALPSSIIPQESINKQIILFAGRLLALKGVDTLIDAIPKVLKSFGSNDILFVFAGPGELSRYLAKIKEKNLSSSCLFTGPLPRENLSLLMKAAEIVVVPSLIENAPYTVLESMACGVPVVATNVGGLSEIIEDGYSGVLVKRNSSEVFANSLITLLGNASLRSSMGRHAKDTIKNRFSWAVNIEKYCHLYEQVLNQNTKCG